jgi:uncharacterized protein (DUF983 family)
MPPTKHEIRVNSGVRDLAHQCPACRSPKVAVSFSTVAADYLTCRNCEHTWSVARMATSAAFRISRIIGVLGSARS